MKKNFILKLTIVLLLFQNSTTVLAFSGTPIIKVFKGVKLSKITTTALQNFPKNEQIKLLIYKGVQTARISPMQSLSLQAKLIKIPNGENVLLACLKDPKCVPQSAIKNLDTYKIKQGSYPSQELSKMVATDDLYLKLALKYPSKNPQNLRLEAGKVAENLMDKNFKTSGWTRIEGEVGRNGFDGLYVKLDKNANVKDIMVVESKYGKSALLSRTSDGARQMSSQWSRKKIDALIKKHPNNPMYEQIKLQQDKVKYRLYRLRATDNKVYQSIEKINHSRDKKNITLSGLSGSEKLRSVNKTENTVIDRSKPSNQYQTTIIHYLFGSL